MSKLIFCGGEIDTYSCLRNNLATWVITIKGHGRASSWGERDVSNCLDRTSAESVFPSSLDPSGVGSSAEGYSSGGFIAPTGVTVTRTASSPHARSSICWPRSSIRTHCVGTSTGSHCENMNSITSALRLANKNACKTQYK